MRNSSRNIYANLMSYWLEYNTYIKELDVLFIAGDLYHRLLSKNSSDAIIATEWLMFILKVSAKNNTRVRVLEGTPSHDFNQVRHTDSIVNAISLDNLDFKYIENITIENIDGYDILYVPDEVNHDSKDTEKEIDELLRDRGIDKVDIAIMHGSFNYQIPMVELKSSHNEAYFLNKVRYNISIGHVHTFSIYSRIIAQGSFDRLAHGEEEKKGGVFFHVDKSRNESSYIFLENKKAMVFDTLKLKAKSIKESINEFSKFIKSRPLNSAIRVVLTNSNIHLKDDIYLLTKKHPAYYITIKIEDDKDSVDKKRTLLEIPEQISITKDNIRGLLMEEIQFSSIEPTIGRYIMVELDKIL